MHPCRYERVLKNLHSKEDDSSRFFSDFNPMCDRKTKKLRRRPRRKVVKEMNFKKDEDVSEEPVAESVALNPVSEKASVYDSKGVLLQSGLDLCDCLEDSCPGCHLPCSNCSSPKCGHLCRSTGLQVLLFIYSRALVQVWSALAVHFSRARWLSKIQSLQHTPRFYVILIWTV